MQQSHENVLIILHSQIYSNHSITEGATFPTTSGSGSKMTGDGVSSVIPGCGVTKSPISVVKPGEAKSSSVTIKSFIVVLIKIKRKIEKNNFKSTINYFSLCFTV